MISLRSKRGLRQSPIPNLVWAVLDHNSEFTVAIPEPGTLALVGVALVTALALRRRKR